MTLTLFTETLSAFRSLFNRNKTITYTCFKVSPCFFHVRLKNGSEFKMAKSKLTLDIKPGDKITFYPGKQAPNNVVISKGIG